MSTSAAGALSEAVAVQLLGARGYRVVERNFRVRSAELDVVATDRAGVLCFVEVRSRATGEFGGAADTIDHQKRAKVTRGARAYVALRQPQFETARFDVVAITGGSAELIRDAWRLEQDL